MRRYPIIKKGVRSKHVFLLQVILYGLKYIHTLASNPRYGHYLEQAIRTFQKDHGLVTDGIVGPKTWKALLTALHDRIIVVETTAPSYSKLKEVFGDFRDPHWAEENLTVCRLDDLKDYYAHVQFGWVDVPAFLHKGYVGFTCHRLVASKFCSVFKQIAQQGLHKEIRTFDGCYNPRYMRGARGKWSTHSWAIAIDLNARWNRFGTNGSMHPGIVEIFEKFGFVWGGRWKTPDPMHFQFCK